MADATTKTPAKLRLYAVSAKAGGEKKYVRATSPTQAEAHVLGTLFETKLATQDEVLEIGQSGIAIETAEQRTTTTASAGGTPGAA